MGTGILDAPPSSASVSLVLFFLIHSIARGLPQSAALLPPCLRLPAVAYAHTECYTQAKIA